ncbi:MAG: AbrB/MazE/SpoVT family DNA-binding domain-containing protein [Acidobacteriota bacterium]|nr:AbrB/MazE/SpoVT family DNA-binding domain-containing protein [Acidobacteriota bacterium]
MRVAIDDVGRMVIPKALRREMGVEGATELELTAADGKIELAVADTAARVEVRDGFPVIVTDEPIAPLSAEEARAAVERARR